MAQRKSSSFFSKEDAPWEMHIVTVIRICSYIGMAAIVIMTFLTFAHSVGRYAFNSPIAGMVELSKVLLVMSIFLISAYCMVEKGHISVGLLIDRMAPRKQAIIDTVTYSIAFVIGSIAVWRTLVKGLYTWGENPVSAVLRIPDAPFMMIVFFGWAILVIAVALHLRHRVLKAVGKEVE